MCTTYVFQDPKTGDLLEVRESWEPLEPSDSVPDVAGRKTSFSKMTRTLNMVPAPVPRRARGTRCGGSTVRIARRPCKATGGVNSPTARRMADFSVVLAMATPIIPRSL